MRKITIIILILIMIISGAYLVSYYTDRNASREEYAAYVTMTEAVPSDKISGSDYRVITGEGQREEDMPILISLPAVDEKELKSINPQYRAWLYIPDTGISYPVTEPFDNDKYLKQSFDNEKRSSGCLFFDEFMPAFSTYNTVIHGHNMKDRSMFGNLKNYRDKDYALSHDRLYLLADGKWSEYLLLSVYDTKEDDPVPYRQAVFGKEELKEYIKELKERSEVETAFTDESASGVLTLSTCSLPGRRLIVHFALSADK